MSSDDVSTDDRICAVVFTDEHRETRETVLEDRDALLNMALAVHSELGRAASCCHDYIFECPRLDQRSRIQQSVSRTGAESSGVGSRSIHKTCDLSCSLGKVAAASLVHVAAGFLSAVDDIVDLCRIDARNSDEVEQ